MTSVADRGPQHSLARTLAATVGALPVAVALGIVLARELPISTSARFAVGLYGVAPLWVTLACIVFLARSGARAWAALAIAFAVLVVLIGCLP